MGSLGLVTIKADGDRWLPADANLKIENLPVPLTVDSVGASALITTKQAAIKLSWACEVVQVRVWCRVRTGSSDPTVDVYEDTATILSSAVTLAADATHYTAIIADGQIAALAELTVRCTTASNGSISDLVVQITIAAP